MKETIQKTKAATQPATEAEQHQSNMHPLYPNHKGYKPSKKTAVGAIILANEAIEYNHNRAITRLKVRNTGDRPIQVGSHFHFFEVNRYLEFDRDAAFGTHLNIPATTAIRFEPGDSREVEVVPYAGKQRIIGFNHLTNSYTGAEDTPTYYPARQRAIARMHAEGFKCECMQQKSNKKVK